MGRSDLQSRDGSEPANHAMGVSWTHLTGQEAPVPSLPDVKTKPKSSTGSSWAELAASESLKSSAVLQAMRSKEVETNVEGRCSHYLNHLNILAQGLHIIIAI